MYAYIPRARSKPDEKTNELFRRFKEVPGLVHAFNLQGEQDPEDTEVVAIWESPEAAERYLNSAPLRREVDEAVPQITRTMYKVLDSK